MKYLIKENLKKKNLQIENLSENTCLINILEKIIENHKIAQKESIIKRIQSKSFRFKNDNLSKIKNFKPIHNRKFIQKNFSQVESSRRMVDPLAFSIIDFHQEVKEQYNGNFKNQENNSNDEEEPKSHIQMKKESMVTN